MKKNRIRLRCLLAAVISLFLLLPLSACGSQSITGIGNNVSASADPSETVPDGESLLEMVFTQPSPDDSGRITYYRDAVTDVLYMKFYRHTGSASAGVLSVMLDPDTGKPLTYTRYTELYSTLKTEAKR